MPLIAYLEFFLLEEAHSESSTPGKTTPNIEQLRRSFAQGAKFMGLLFVYYSLLFMTFKIGYTLKTSFIINLVRREDRIFIRMLSLS